MTPAEVTAHAAAGTLAAALTNAPLDELTRTIELARVEILELAVARGELARVREARR